jgi:hypothetical protein
MIIDDRHLLDKIPAMPVTSNIIEKGSVGMGELKLAA